MKTGVAVLGSTGSIGRSTLRVLARQHERFKVVALTALDSAAELAAQARETGAKFVGLVNHSANSGSTPSAESYQLSEGTECLLEAATHPEVGVVVNAVVGAAGLRATIAALQAGKRVALANKESLVMAGDVVMRTARECGGEIIPIDSEHSAVLQCIAGHPTQSIARLILTASGGPFREWSKEQLDRATVDDALAHPTWNMGRKITVDSATLANKALEVIEAHFLFSLPYDSIEVVVHPQSIVHAFAEFVDGSILSQVGFPDMELPILYALTYPERVGDSGIRRFDPVAAGTLTFERLREDAFPAFSLGVQSGRQGGTAPTVFNASNEVAVQGFLAGKISFGEIAGVIESVLRQHEPFPADDLDVVLEVDRWAREKAESICC